MRAWSVAAGVALALAGPALAVTGAAADDPSGDIPITVTVPDLSAQPFTVDDAQLSWSVNAETGAGAYFGGCNFLMAGVPGATGDTGGGRVWTAADGLYRAQDGAVQVMKPTADGTLVPATFDTRCTDRDGVTVTAANGRTTESRVVLDGGRGEVDPRTGTARIQWTGTFTVVFYGGLTYWWASDPVLEIAADGTGRLTATAGGFATSMEDMTQWAPLTATPVVLADLTAADLAADNRGVRAANSYVGTAVQLPAGATAQVDRTAENAAYWGSFPQSFVDFQARTGQLAYWYSSGGLADQRKPGAGVLVSYDASVPLTPSDERPAVAAEASVGGSSARSAASARAGAARASDVLAAPQEQLVLPAVAAQTVGLDRPGLVPAVSGSGDAAAERVAWGMTALLLSGAGSVVGFRRGWLVLPWR